MAGPQARGLSASRWHGDQGVVANGLRSVDLAVDDVHVALRAARELRDRA